MDGVSTWRVIDLCGIVQERFGVSYSESGLAKLLHGLDLSWQTPRPQHPQSDAAAQASFKKVVTGQVGRSVATGIDSMRQGMSQASGDFAAESAN